MMDQQRECERDEMIPTMQRSLLSDKAIEVHRARGTVVIEPFSPSNLGTASYDVTLGEHYFRETQPLPGDGIYNPYDRCMVERVWAQPRIAERAADYEERMGRRLEGVNPDDRIIWISPGETILAHTNEFIGGRQTVTTMMKARSSMGRSFIEVCKCAGFGDIGFVNRWAMEITNNSRYYSIPLVVGRRIAQIVFFDTDGTIGNRSYSDKGKYQTHGDFNALQIQWDPRSMLPKLYEDFEAKQNESRN